MKKKNRYNWHFWIPSFDMQVVIENGSFHGAKAHLKDKLSYYNRPSPEFEFQFGDKILPIIK